MHGGDGSPEWRMEEMVGALDNRDWTMEGITIGGRGFRSGVSMCGWPQRFLGLLSIGFSVGIEELEEGSPPLTGISLFLQEREG